MTVTGLAEGKCLKVTLSANNKVFNGVGEWIMEEESRRRPPHYPRLKMVGILLHDGLIFLNRLLHFNTLLQLINLRGRLELCG